MPLSIRNERAELLAREVGVLTGKSLTQVIIDALEEKLERLKGSRLPSNTFEEVMAISQRCSALPDLDQRSTDEILGYNAVS
ncbi:type II toxin-antitoxin system VapB family antitoxin [uncultured Thiothrix sp.]|jgi:antitoxin VapB|uniref:type II toxin-antitoxin system VapB family antitoxin n=1 Tax=uncultured Thiothrix sp. TaxID=223185 RepID=UPI0026321992|nr:type II toxin-antitoxin system VapB family antitoxin [uncultured Thiothrix sp.]HMT92995.1 type II toxin-antitoxin system VapB family antitoxin [Thiolinea sp.]